MMLFVDADYFLFLFKELIQIFKKTFCKRNVIMIYIIKTELKEFNLIMKYGFKILKISFKFCTL